MKGRDVGVFATEEFTMVTDMMAKSRDQACFCTAHIHELATWRGNAVDAPKEGLSGGRVIDVHGRKGRRVEEQGHRPGRFTKPRSDI
jgi:hypothetical protein